MKHLVADAPVALASRRSVCLKVPVEDGPDAIRQVLALAPVMVGAILEREKHVDPRRIEWRMEDA